MKQHLPLIDEALLAEICERYGIKRLAVFGSAARGEMDHNSDIDILVEFRKGQRIGLRFITLQDELSALFGRDVDLCTPGFLSPHFRQRAVAESRSLYEAA